MPLRKPLIILLVGLALGFAFDRLFNPAQQGVNALVYVTLIIAAFALLVFVEQRQVLPSNLWLFAPLLFFATMIAIRANSFVTFLNACAILLLLAFGAVYLLRRPLYEVDILGYGLAPLLAAFLTLVRGGQVVRSVAAEGYGAARTSRRRSWAPVVRGLLLAVPIVLLFGALLMSADTLFANLLDRLMPNDFAQLLDRLLRHGFIVLAVGFVMTGALAYTLWRNRDSKETDLPAIELGLHRFLGFIESSIVLTGVNLLFLVFVVVQTPYLFGGMLNISLEGFTYAEYARRGFGELVAVSVLVLGLLIVLGTFGHRAPGRQEHIFNFSSTLTVILTIIILVSAFKRLLLYEIAYGFTEMRVYPHVFMIWLALLLGWFLVTLWRLPGRFAVGLVIACLGFGVTLNLMNVDAFIVRQNVARLAPRETTTTGASNFDAAYLITLSDDAVSELIAAQDALASADHRILQANLLERKVRLADERARSSWAEWHLGRARALRDLELWSASQQ